MIFAASEVFHFPLFVIVFTFFFGGHTASPAEKMQMSRYFSGLFPPKKGWPICFFLSCSVRLALRSSSTARLPSGRLSICAPHAVYYVRARHSQCRLRCSPSPPDSPAIARHRQGIAHRPRPLLEGLPARWKTAYPDQCSSQTRGPALSSSLLALSSGDFAPRSHGILIRLPRSPGDVGRQCSRRQATRRG